MDIDTTNDVVPAETSIAKKPKTDEDAMSMDFGNSIVVAGSNESFISESINSDHSDIENVKDDDDDDACDYGDDAYEEEDDACDYDDNDDYLFANDDADDNDDDYLNMQYQFDNVDLPPGVEASVSWLAGPPSSSIPAEKVPSAATDLSASEATSSALVKDLSNKISGDVASCSSSVALGLSDKLKDDFMQKFAQFKQFDVVNDFTDHYFQQVVFNEHQAKKSYAKKIQDEWQILKKNLPDTIYVRVSETRMDLLRAVIVGPEGTPYHDGLFVFDAHFPPAYPDGPPVVHYHSGGLRINPNLYNCGKVCLSLLGTWSGKSTEKWIPNQSTMLQVLVSIQALILNAKPFFNEPGYESAYVGADGERRSKGYSEDAFILSLKTMMYTLRRPPKYFEDLVVGHFHRRAHDILSACRAYMEGVQVGAPISQGVQDDGSSDGFRAAVGKMVNGLVTNFTRYAGADCEQFRILG